VDGQRQTLSFGTGNDAGASLRVRRDLHVQPYAMQVELTPVEPFHKGDPLPVTVDAVDIVPESSSP
jgi:alpha-L-fucosidase